MFSLLGRFFKLSITEEGNQATTWVSDPLKSRAQSRRIQEIQFLARPSSSQKEGNFQLLLVDEQGKQLLIQLTIPSVISLEQALQKVLEQLRQSPHEIPKVERRIS